MIGICFLVGFFFLFVSWFAGPPSPNKKEKDVCRAAYWSCQSLPDLVDARWMPPPSILVTVWARRCRRQLVLCVWYSVIRRAQDCLVGVTQQFWRGGWLFYRIPPHSVAVIREVNLHSRLFIFLSSKYNQIKIKTQKKKRDVNQQVMAFCWHDRCSPSVSCWTWLSNW